MAYEFRALSNRQIENKQIIWRTKRNHMAYNTRGHMTYFPGIILVFCECVCFWVSWVLIKTSDMWFCMWCWLSNPPKHVSQSGREQLRFQLVWRFKGVGWFISPDLKSWLVCESTQTPARRNNNICICLRFGHKNRSGLRPEPRSFFYLFKSTNVSNTRAPNPFQKRFPLFPKSFSGRPKGKLQKGVRP